MSTSRGQRDTHEGDTVAHAQEDTGQGHDDGLSHVSKTAESQTPASQAAPDTTSDATPSARAKKSADMPLESLTPRYVEAHHGTYLRRLEQAVKNPDNLNIALTGRYGAGKSSVLDKFAAEHDKEVLRLAISTLAPGEEGESTTNRIQKEIVKQLLYGASEKVGRNSRFNKIAVLSWPKAFWQSAAVVVPLGVLATVFGVLPRLKWPGDDVVTGWRLLMWVVVGTLVTGLVSVVRMLTYGRFNVSDVSAGGAGLTLTAAPKTFFDKYIDEIVHYFAQESKDIVIFEDLDRFEDPHIFEALRELNVLLNNTPERRRKRGGTAVGRTEPLRFIYAARDSVFSKIDAGIVKNESKGNDAGPDQTAQDSQATQPSPSNLGLTPTPTPSPELDEAAAETLRANRTKFFDVVIPLVPFISHRNARDLLSRLLEDRGITGIDPRLVSTVAQHCTDMRLMRNMCNEYLVFAERLLEPPKPNKTAPGLNATHLFALVVYKNFHLEDFENITRRESDLDKVYDFAQRLIRDTITAHEERIRDLLKNPERFRAREPRANRLAQRLDLLASNVRGSHSSRYGAQWGYYRFKVGNREFDADKVSHYGFWAAVAKACTLDIVLAQQPSGGQTTVGQAFDEDGLRMFAPEALDADRWAAFDQDTIDTEVAKKESEIDELRRADFVDLAKTRFTLTLEDGEAAARKLTSLETPEGPHTFTQLMEATLKSKLARELVRRGYIDRNFSLYGAQFYGNFTGVDVANFMVQHVQPNVMNIDYDLSRPKEGDREGAAANLLLEAEEAGEDLLNTVAAYNIDLVNHLLATDHAGADTVVTHLITGWPGQKARSFMAAYFTAKKARREKLAARLAQCRWREVFTYLTTDDDVPTDARVMLVNAALASFDPHAAYDLDDDVRDFVTDNYRSMPVFTGNSEPEWEQHAPAEELVEHPSERLPERLDEMLRRGKVLFPELAPLRDDIRKLVVEGNRYLLTADNLRTVLNLDSTEPVPLDAVADSEAGTQTVYARCLTNMTRYLAAVDEDDRTDYAVTAPETLVKVLGDVVEQWTEEQVTENEQAPDPTELADLLAHTSSGALLGSLREAPQVTWKALAEAKLFRASLANLEAYRAHEGGTVREHLAALLRAARRIQVDEPGDTLDADGNELDRQAAAVAILNARTLAPQVRVDLVSSLGAATPLPVDGITAEDSDLFARLLEHGLVDDDEATFTHLRTGGWAALGPAIKVSGNTVSVVTADLLEGMVSDALSDSDTAGKVAEKVLNDVDSYVPEDHWDALDAVASYAHTHRVALTSATVRRIARVGHEHGGPNVPRMLRLLGATAPAASADDIVETFLHLGDPYDRITEHGRKFDVDYDDLHDQLLRVLDSADRISRGTIRVPRRRYSVTVK
jgi:hypothetical protein